MSSSSFSSASAGASYSSTTTTMSIARRLVAVVICGLALLATEVTCKKYNVSLTQMATCQEYDLRGSGYMYLDFFYVHAFNNAKMTAPAERLHLKFYVLTSMDAHIMLSVTNRPRLMDRVYEIVIGAGGNTFSAIRTSMGRRRVATSQEPYLLSIFDPTPIEIIQMKDGSLLVHIPGFKEEPLLNFTDSSPLTINYVSFSTFGAISARWFYDCQFDGFENEMQMEGRPLTHTQQLIANITAKGQDRLLPYDLKSVHFAFHIRSVAFNQDASILKTRLRMMMYWNDSSLQWNPKDFYGIETLVQPFLDIWTPKVRVLNGALDTFRNFNPTHEYRIHANGSLVLFVPDAEINTWCHNGNLNWPHDTVDCEVMLGLQELQAAGDGNIQLVYDATAPLSQEPINTLSEWSFVKVTVGRIGNGRLTRFTDDGVIQSMDGDVAVGFTMVRNSSFYKNVFTMPILACQSLVILSFLLAGYRRGALLLAVLIVICLGLMYITKHAPTSYVPDIMVTYQHMLHVTTFCYFLHIAVMWLELFPPKEKPWSWVMAIVNCSPLRLVLCMRYEDASEYVAIQEHPWRELAKILNNVSFIAINVMFVAIDVIFLPRT